MKYNKWLKLLTLSTWTILTIYLFLQTTTKTQTEILFSPDNHPQQKLLSLIKKTNKEIQLAIYTFTNPMLAKALVNAKDRVIKDEQKMIAQLDKALKNARTTYKDQGLFSKTIRGAISHI